MSTEIISSVRNPQIRHLRKLLTNSRYRNEQGLAVAEGIHLISSYLQTGAVPEQIIYSQSATTNPEVLSLLDQLESRGVARLAVKDSLFDSLASIHASVGVMMLFAPAVNRPPERLNSDALLLEAVQDPGNLGTILRTAAAAGVGAVYLSSGSASAWSPKCLRAGMGAQFSLEIFEDVDLLRLVDDVTVPVLATDLAAETSPYQIDLVAPTAWVFGSEGQGVSARLLAACTQRLQIPQASASVESLNVSAAVAICLFEQRRQRSVAA